jgi:hypothetical protein
MSGKDEGVTTMGKGFWACIFSIHRVFSFFLPAATLAAFLSSSPVIAQIMVRPVNLTYLVQRADVIVQGRVTEVVQESLPDYPNILTIKVTLEVEKMVRGPIGKTYTFREVLLGNRSNESKGSYKVGQQLFLFLPLPSKYGLSSPIGIEQGRFHISSDPKGGSTVVNESSNLGLFSNVVEAANLAGHRLSASQLDVASTKGGPVNLRGFASLVESLTSMPRIR